MGIILKKTDEEELVKTKVGRIKLDQSDIKTAEQVDDVDAEVSQKEIIIAVVVIIILIAIIFGIIKLIK